MRSCRLLFQPYCIYFTRKFTERSKGKLVQVGSEFVVFSGRHMLSNRLQPFSHLWRTFKISLGLTARGWKSKCVAWSLSLQSVIRRTIPLNHCKYIAQRSRVGSKGGIILIVMVTIMYDSDNAFWSHFLATLLHHASYQWCCFQSRKEGDVYFKQLQSAWKWSHILALFHSPSMLQMISRYPICT